MIVPAHLAERRDYGDRKLGARDDGNKRERKAREGGALEDEDVTVASKLPLEHINFFKHLEEGKVCAREAEGRGRGRGSVRKTESVRESVCVCFFFVCVCVCVCL